MNFRQAIKTAYGVSPRLVQTGFGFIYGKMPVSIRYIVGSDKAFRVLYRFLQRSDLWSRQKLEQYQLFELRRLLHHTYDNVPYYKRVFRQHHLKPSDVKTLGDIRKVPYLTREDVRENLLDMVATNYPKSKLTLVTTGGSTGLPLGLYYDKYACGVREWAFMVTIWSRFGYRVGDKTIVLGERSSAGPGFWQYKGLRQIYFSSYHLTDQNLPTYIKEMKKIKPYFVRGFPSVLSILARYMRENSVSPFPTVKAIFCGSENIYQPQRQLLEEAFNCRVSSWYGHTEQAVLGGDCEFSLCYHLFPQYGVAELLGRDDEPVADEDGVGEIVATGFTNYAMPLIRYRTMDLGVHTNQTCECGRSYPLLKRVEGRTQDFVVGRDGRLISLTGLISGQHFRVLAQIKDMQIVQEKNGEATILIVKGREYSQKNEQEMVERIRRITDDQIHVTCEYVGEIPRTRIGKRLFLVQKLPVPRANLPRHV